MFNQQNKWSLCFFNKISLEKHKLHLSHLFCCNHTFYCVNMVSVTSASHYIMSASHYLPHYQSRSSMYISVLIPRNFTELVEAVPIDMSCVFVSSGGKFLVFYVPDRIDMKSSKLKLPGLSHTSYFSFPRRLSTKKPQDIRQRAILNQAYCASNGELYSLYSKTYLKRSLKNRQNKGLKDKW